METKTNTFKNDLSNLITLTSPTNFPDELKKYTPIYFIMIIFLSLLCGKEVTYALTIIVGAGGGFVIVNIISAFKVDALRNKLFTLEKNLTKEELANLITLPLAKLNMNVEILTDNLRVIHNNIEYDIFLYPNENAFRIWPQKSMLFRFLAGRVYINLYKKAIFAMPIIAYTIQTEINKSSNENSNNEYDEQASFIPININQTSNLNQKKKIITIGGIVTAILVVLFLIIPSESSKYIDQVKNGTLNSHQSVTVGKAFEDFFSDTDWEYFTSENNQNIVEFTGTYNINNKKYKTLIQFAVNKNSTEFEMKYLEVNGKPQNLLSWNSLLSNIYEDI